MMRPRHLALVAVLAATLAPAAHAERLRELFDAALGYDATYLAQLAASDAAEPRAAQARALRLPTVGLQGGVTATDTRTPDAAQVESLRTTVTQVGLAAQQSLFNAANGATISQAERGVLVAEAQRAAARQDLIVRLAAAYFDVLAARDALDAVQVGRKAIAEQLAAAQRAFEVGTATIIDTREAQARFDLNTAQEVAAANDLHVKQLALEQLVGKAGVQLLSLAPPATLPELRPTGMDDWLGLAEAGNTQIAQARLGLEVAQLETEKAKAGHLPTVALSGSYGRTHTSGNMTLAAGGQVPYTSNGNVNQASVGITVNVPLFAGFAIENRVRETTLLEDQARQQLEAARRGVAQGTRAAFLGVQAGRSTIKALEAAEGSSKLALESTRLGYEVGVRVNLDVLDAQAQYLRNQVNLAKARYDVLVGDLRLRQAAGTLAPDDLNAVDALLK